LERVGEVAYMLELPNQLSDVHDVFHISQLKKGLKPHDKKPLPIDRLDVKEDLTVVEHLIRILDIGLLRCARSSGVTVQKMRQPRKERMN
jgi:hypothetical protein